MATYAVQGSNPPAHACAREIASYSTAEFGPNANQTPQKQHEVTNIHAYLLFIWWLENLMGSKLV